MSSRDQTAPPSAKAPHECGESRKGSLGYGQDQHGRPNGLHAARPDAGLLEAGEVRRGVMMLLVYPLGGASMAFGRDRRGRDAPKERADAGVYSPS